MWNFFSNKSSKIEFYGTTAKFRKKTEQIDALLTVMKGLPVKLGA